MTTLLTVKLRRDLRVSWSRFVLMVIAIALSLTVFGGVLAAWAGTRRETASAYMGTEPASATIVLDRAVRVREVAEIAAEAENRPGVIAATGRTQFDADVEVDGALRDNPLQVFVAAPDDHMRMVKFDVQEGSWPPAPDEVFIGEDSVDLLDVAVGDVVAIKTARGEPLELQVAGTVYDPSLSPAPQEQRGHAYLSTTALATAGEPAALDQLKIQVADPGQAVPTRDRDAVIAVASDVSEWLESEYGVAISEIQVPEPHAHPHQAQADALLLSLLAGGAAALLLSSILVASMLNILFTQQIPQIGILKAIGARSGRIGRHYLTLTLLVAAVATVLGLGPAILIGRAGATLVLGFLGIETTNVAAPWWAYPVILTVGLGVPPLMTLVPLIKASRITVRAAIDHHGAGYKPSSTKGLLARLGRVRRLDRGLLMALRNTIRRPARFLLSVGLLASAGTVFVAGMSLSSGTEAIAEEQKAQRNWDVDVQLGRPTSLEEVATVVGRLPEVTLVEGLNASPTGLSGPGRVPVTRTYPDQGHGRVSVIAVPAEADLFTVPKLREGRWLNPREMGAVVLNQIARNDTVPDAGVGDRVQLSVGGTPTTWRVVGIVEELGGSGGAVYATAEGFADALGLPQRVKELRIATDRHDEQTRNAVADDVEEALTSSGIEVKSAASVSRSEAISEGHAGPLVTIMLLIAITMGVVGAIGLGSTMSANVLDRTREFGVMHAIGALPKTVRRIVVAEGVLLAVTSCVVAIVPALGLIALLGAGLGNLFMDAPLPYRVSILAVAIWLVVVIVGGALATDSAATRASRITVREALAYL